MRNLIVLFMLFIQATLCDANALSGLLKNAPYTVCFTPQGHCTALIDNTIAAAKSSIDVQAYSFTSKPIAEALARAYARGVKVEILLDRSNIWSRYSAIHFFEHKHIPFLIDFTPAIAHNKVMIIDSNTVITGSFNFTYSAQARNTENVLIVKSQKLAEAYLRNFNYRQSQSVKVKQYWQLQRSGKLHSYTISK